MSKKLISAALTATTFAWAVGVAFVPVAAHAQSTSDLQAQIAALLAQIQQLQTQLNAQGGSTATSGTASYSFTKDLTLGSKGADVTALQQILINAGDLTAVSAPTGFFGGLTKAALAKYQAANGIKPASGYFGPITMKFVNSLKTSSTTTTTTTTTTTYPAGCTSSVGYSSTTGQKCSGATTTTVAAPATGLTVSTASDNPSAGSLISSSNTGAARVPVLSVSFTAGNASAATVSDVKFTKTGVLSDSSIAGAYLTENGKVLYQYSSLNQGVLDFSGMDLNVPAGQTVELTLAIDVSSGLSAGNTTAFALSSASDVTAMDSSNNAITATGAFPLNGNTFTVTSVSNPSLASLTVASTSIGNQVTAGTQDNLVGAWNFTVQNSKVYLKGINFRVIGSANNGDLRNVKLMVNGTQVGATLSAVGSDGTAYFDASATPGVLNTGSNNVQIFADVMGSPSDDFTFEILNGYDIYAIDSQYNSPITAGSNSGTKVKIQQGQITVTQDANTPTGNLSKGQSQITLAKYDIYAAGEAVKVKFLPFKIVFTGTVTSTANELQNIAITDDAGNQVGTTINTPPSSNGTDNASSTGVYTDSFGSSASPINYIVPANTTRVLSFKADVQTTATFSTVTASLTAGTDNLQGMTSSQTASSQGATGSALTLVSSALTATANNALGTQTISSGVTNQEIGSYSLAASSAEGVTVNNLSITMGASSTAFSNLKAMINGTQFGTTQPTVSASGVYTFSGTPFQVPAGSTVNVDIYADTLSTAATGTITAATSLSGLSGTGMVSYSAISLASTVTGQSVTFAGATTITVTADPSQAAAGNIVMGSKGNSLASFRFTETGNIENVKMTDLTVTDSATPNAKAAFSNLSLYNGSNLLGTAGSAITGASSTDAYATGTITYSDATSTATTTVSIGVGIGNSTTTVTTASINSGSSSSTIATAVATAINAATGLGVTATSTGGVVTVTASSAGTAGNSITLSSTNDSNSTAAVTAMTGGAGSSTYTYAFHFATPVIIPQANSVSLVLKGDAASYASAGATDNSAHIFSIASTTDVTALGATSNKTATVSSVSGATGNTQTVLRSLITAAVTPAGTASGRSKANPDILGNITLTANNAGSVSLNKILVTFSGNAVTTNLASTTLVSSAQLYDQNGNNVVTAGEATSTNATTTTGGYMVWTFNKGFSLSGGSPYTFQLRVNSQNIPAVANTAESLSANIQNAGDIEYSDSLDSAAVPALTLPATVVPLIVNSVTYATGS